MSRLQRFFARLFLSLRSGNADRELSRELDAHLQLLEDQFVAKGMTREDARYAARREFHGVEQTKELQRDARSFRWLAGWPMDLKLGARMLVKSPGLTVIAVIALAVAFGAGATYWQFLKGMTRPSLDFPGGDRLVGVVVRDTLNNHPELQVLPEFRAWRAGVTRLEHLGGYRNDIEGEVVTDDGRGARVDGVRISAAAFRLVPAAPLMGRPLVDADEDPSAPPVAVIGEAVWQSRFNRDPNVIGAGVTIQRTRYTVVGVMPKGFGFPQNQVLWLPLQDDGAYVKPGEGPGLTLFGRLIEGATREDALAELQAAMPAESRAVPNRTLAVQPYVRSLLHAYDQQDSTTALWAVNVVFIALLCVCAANVATLVFGRTVTRESEITVRTALGASRGRIVSQLVAEALVLASLAGVAGLTFAAIALRWVRPAWQQGNESELPFWWKDGLGVETMLYVALLVVFAALIVGGIPAMKATGAQVQARLKHAGAASTMQFGRLWTYIIVGQIGATVVFLLGVLAMAWSFKTIIAQYENVAFSRGHYMRASVYPAERWGNHNAQIPPTYHAARDEFIRRLQQSPAIANVTYTTRMPGADQERTEIEVSGASASVRVAHVGPGFFETLERPLIAGRLMTPGEVASGANVAVVDESFVRHVLNNRTAVGQQVRVRDAATGQLGPLVEIAGVTADVSTSPRKTLKDARLYRPIGAIQPTDVTLIIHARAGYRTMGLGAVATAVRETRAAAPAGLVVNGIEPLDAGSGGDVIEYVFAALGIIGAVALLLSTAGTYALVSFTLARRTREIGIRIALGASPRRIVTGVLSRAIVQISAGVVLGLLPGMSIVASVSAEDGRNGLTDGLLAGAAVAVFVLIVAAVSCTVPLRRALGVQPTEALRTT